MSGEHRPLLLKGARDKGDCGVLRQGDRRIRRKGWMLMAVGDILAGVAIVVTFVVFLAWPVHHH